MKNKNWLSIYRKKYCKNEKNKKKHMRKYKHFFVFYSIYKKLFSFKKLFF